MTEREMKRIINQQADIPVVVENRIEDTLKSIMNSGNANTEKNRKAAGNVHRYFRLAVLAAAILAMAGASVYAAVQYFDIADFVAGKNLKIADFWNARNLGNTESMVLIKKSYL